MSANKMPEETRAMVHRELDAWLDRVEERLLSYDNGEWHTLTLEGAYAGHTSDDQLQFQFMIERSERVDL
jgi:hypothetical protein